MESVPLAMECWLQGFWYYGTFSSVVVDIEPLVDLLGSGIVTVHQTLITQPPAKKEVSLPSKSEDVPIHSVRGVCGVERLGPFVCE